MTVVCLSCRRQHEACDCPASVRRTPLVAQQMADERHAQVAQSAKERLASAGWRATPSGRYVHPEFEPVVGSDRRRVFTEAEALTLTDGMLIEDADERATDGVNA